MGKKREVGREVDVGKVTSGEKGDWETLRRRDWETRGLGGKATGINK